MKVSWTVFDECVDSIVDKLGHKIGSFECVVGLMRGGVVLANVLSHRINVPAIYIPWYLREDREFKKGETLKKGVGPLVDVGNTFKSILVVDDIADTGTTLLDVHSVLKNIDAVQDTNDVYYAVCIQCGKLTSEQLPPNLVSAKTHWGTSWVHFPWDT